MKRTAILNYLPKTNYYRYYVSIFVNGEMVGIGAYFKKITEALNFLDDCKIDSYLLNYNEEGKNKWKIQ